MEGIEINHSILQAICKSKDILVIEKDKFSPNIVKQIIKWNQQLQPSVQMTQYIIASFLLPHIKNEDQQQNNKQNSIQKNEQREEDLCKLYKAVEDIPKTLFLLQQNKCPKNFMRAYLSFVKINMSKIQHLIRNQYILEQWVNISPELLEIYCDTFSILIENYSPTCQNVEIGKLIIKCQDFDKKIFQLIEKKNYPHCMSLIRFSNSQKHHINKLLQKMTNNKEASKAADYVKSLKLNPADYPALSQRLYKNTARHFLSKNGWEYAEQIFQSHPEALACIVEDLIFKKKHSEALSIWFRNKCCRNYIIKQDAVLFLKPFVQLNGKNIQQKKLKQNFLHKDQFGPSNKQKYFSLEDFNIQQQNVYWIDQNNTNINQCLKDILNSQILGIDTESIVGQTKFDKSQHSKFEQAATIQVATRQKIYLIDGFTVKHIPQVKQTFINYIRKNGLIVGHTLDNDIQCLLKSLGCNDEEIKQLKCVKVVDVWKLFKAVYPKHRFSSLAFITEKMLGKQLCKEQTLTNWQRRPLRRNQIHYAAMDAMVVIKIYEKFIQQVGEQMIEYYCSMDGNEL